MTIEIDSTGTIRTLGDLPPELSGVRVIRRASHILPVCPVKRLVFIVLRLLFGERGRIAEWTRQWQGPWQARIIRTGQTFTAQSRRVCIRWEHETIEKIGLENF